jgi:hypothetical protein
MVAPVIDQACADAVDLAREAAVRRAEVFGVAEHLGVTAEDTRVATHYFACAHPGYPGWRWAVTVARASRGRQVTVDEVTLVPGEGALSAPRWVPWAERVGPGDLAPGIILPTDPGDPRLEPGFTGGELAADADPVEWSATRGVAAELGLGRERVLSAEGRDLAAVRWLNGDGGPANEMTESAPARCHTCGYFVALSGGLGRLFGACANEYSPSDGSVVSRDHGCGGHSDVVAPASTERVSAPVWDTISVDTSLFA